MSRWTRPQQLAAAGYGVWSAFWTLFVGFVLLTPARPAGVLGALIPAAISLAIGVLAFRGVRWAFWPAMVYFTLVGLGAIWVPLRRRPTRARTVSPSSCTRSWPISRACSSAAGSSWP